MSTGCIHNNDFVLLFAEKCYTFLCNLNGIRLISITKERTLDFGSILFKLLKSTGSKRVSTYQTYTPPFL